MAAVKDFWSPCLIQGVPVACIAGSRNPVPHQCRTPTGGNSARLGWHTIHSNFFLAPIGICVGSDSLGENGRASDFFPPLFLYLFFCLLHPMHIETGTYSFFLFYNI